MVSEAVERLVRLDGHVVDDASRVAAREAMERGLAKHGDEVFVLTEQGGFGLAQAAARHGDNVWRLARLSADAPRALAARVDSLLAIGKRWGDDAVKIEIKAPACSEVLAEKLSAEGLRDVAARASEQEIKRFAALATHCSSRDVQAGMTVWERSGSRVLEHLTPARIAAYGIAGALMVASWEAPEMLLGLAEAALKGLLGPVFMVSSWLFVLLCLVLSRRPLLWLIRRATIVVREPWQTDTKAST